MQQRIFLFVLLTFMQFLTAQNNTNTPYSLFGLGVENKTATGGLTGLGNTGIAQSNNFQINIYNPATLGNIFKNTFLYEFGLNATYSKLKNSDITETIFNGNISHFAVAFPIRKNFGMGLGLLPYTKTGYNIDSESPIEGTTDTFITRTTGTGGLNKFYIATGFQPLKNFSLGVNMSVLFGTIEEESILFLASNVSISDRNYYKGAKLETGFQYKLPIIKGIETTIGGVLELPTSLSGSQTRTSYKVSSSGFSIVIDEEIENDLDDFHLPISYGIGITSKVNKTITTSLDYRKLNWGETNRNLNNETYVNESIYAFGLQYLPSKKKYEYWSNIKYRFGVNYNTGFIQVNNKQIDSYFLSFGLGLPMKKNSFDSFNLSYSYGKEGTLENSLIQENFHKITLNLNFVGNWFNKRKID